MARFIIWHFHDSHLGIQGKFPFYSSLHEKLHNTLYEEEGCLFPSIGCGEPYKFIACPCTNLIPNVIINLFVLVRAFGCVHELNLKISS
jgi:hypothetical protein